MREKRKYMVRAADALSGAARRLGIKEKMALYRIWDRWEGIVGQQIAAHARPERWQRGALVVRVEHPSWMQELSFLKAQLAQRLKDALPETPIRGIRFEIGELSQPPGPKAPVHRTFSRKPLKDEEHEFIERAANEIPDPEIREAARRAMRRGFERG